MSLEKIQRSKPDWLFIDWSLVAGTQLSHPQFCNWNVIPKEATVCFKTMRTPPNGRVGFLECLSDWIHFWFLIWKNCALKTKVAPLSSGIIILTFHMKAQHVQTWTFPSEPLDIKLMNSLFHVHCLKSLFHVILYLYAWFNYIYTVLSQWWWELIFKWEARMGKAYRKWKYIILLETSLRSKYTDVGISNIQSMGRVT